MGISKLLDAVHQINSNDSEESRLQKIIRQKTFSLDSKQELIPSTSQQLKKSDEKLNFEQKNKFNNQQSNYYNQKSNSLDQNTNFKKQNKIPDDQKLNLFSQKFNLNKKINEKIKEKFNDENKFNFYESNYKENINEKSIESFKFTKVKENSKKINENSKIIEKNFNKTKNEVDDRLTKTYSWKNKVYEIVTGKQQKNQLTYQNEYDFFTKQSDIVNNNNEIISKNRNYCLNKNLYYPTIHQVESVTSQNIKEEVKNFFNENKNLFLSNRVLQRILIEFSQNFDDKYLKFFSNYYKQNFDLRTNIKDDVLNDDKKLTLKIDDFDKEKNLKINNQLIDCFSLKNIKISFLTHENNISENFLVSELIYHIETIFYLKDNQIIENLTEKIKKLKELIDLIKNCYQSYINNSNKDYRFEKIVNNILKNYILFLKILFDERDKYILDYRLKLFKVLKLWKDIQLIRQKNGSLTEFNLKFREKLNEDDNYQFNSMIENRLNFEENYFLIKKNLNNKQNVSLFNDNQLNQETKNEIMNNLKKNTFLIDGRLPGEPKFYDFEITYDNIIENKIPGFDTKINDSNEELLNKNLNNNSKNENFMQNELSISNEILDENLNKDELDKNLNKKKLNENKSLNEIKEVKIENKDKNNKKFKDENLKKKKNLNEKEFLIKIYQDKQIIYETKKIKPDFNLQLCFNDLNFNMIIHYNKPISINFYEDKNDKQKLINESFVNFKEIFLNSLLHNNLNLNIQTEFVVKKFKFVLSLNFLKQDKNNLDLENLQKSINLNDNLNLIKNLKSFNNINSKNKLNQTIDLKLRKYFNSDNNLKINFKNRLKSNSDNNFQKNSILELKSNLENLDSEKSFESKSYSEKNFDSINTLETNLESITNSITNLESTFNSETNSDLEMNSIEKFELKKNRNNFLENSTSLKSNVDSIPFKNLIVIIFKIENDKLNLKNLNDFNNKLQFIIKMKDELEKQNDLNKFLSLIKQNYEKTNRKNIFNQNCDPIQLNQRLLLLKQRNELDEEFDLIKQRIPLHDSQYLSFLIKDENYLKKQENNKLELKDTNLNIDLLKNYDEKYKNAINFLINSRRKLINLTNSWNKCSKNYEDFVYEEIDTSLTTLNFNFLFFNKKIKRPLKPNRKERKNFQSLQQNNKNQSFNNQVSNEKVKIMIHIKQGINIPIRKINKNLVKDVENSNKPNEFLEETLSINSIESIISKNLALDLISNDQKVSPFFEIKFQDQVLYTSINEGNQPAWNESYKINISVPNEDYTPNNLLKINDFICLNLYDQIDKNEKEMKNWLGSIKIPFSSLYLNTKIEGTFLLNKPYHSTFYDFDFKQKLSLSNQQNKENQENKTNSLIKLFLTIDPQLNLPTKIEFKCNTNEEIGIFNYAKEWQFQLTKNNNRNIKSIVINLINGKQTIVTRYLNPIEPPLEILSQHLDLKTNIGDNFKKSYKSILMQNLARYVSLIPLIKNELLTVGLMEDIWCDCDQFLKINLGSIEEHAILLCNYFLYLSLNCGLVLGSGVPEGKTCYVIVWLNEISKSSNDFYLKVQLWNPITGICYNTSSDNFFTMSKIDSIITKDNVYANIQKSDLTNQVNFNIYKTYNWKPLFSSKQKISLSTVQPVKINYETINQNYVKSLEQQIEIYLKESLMNWRVQKKTFFNRFCQKEIKKELVQMEYKVCNFIETDPIEEINKILSTNKNYGLLLNSSFTGISDLAELLYSTNIHSNLDDKIDFVISIHLHPYPNNVYSTWIYCAIISRN